LALVEVRNDFDKNPRLVTAVGFLLPAPPGLKPRIMIKTKSKISIKNPRAWTLEVVS